MILASLIAGALHLAWPNIALPHKVELTTEGMRRRAAYKVRTKAYHLAGWEIVIARDGFTGQARCRLFARADLGQGRMSYARGVVGFHLDDDHDVSQAWYGVDDQAPKPWRADFPTLVARGVSLEGGSLVNPTGGVVLIAADALSGARTVTIRASATSSPKRFRLKGFEQALAAARANGCASDAVFERDRW